MQPDNALVQAMREAGIEAPDVSVGAAESWSPLSATDFASPDAHRETLLLIARICRERGFDAQADAMESEAASLDASTTTDAQRPSPDVELDSLRGRVAVLKAALEEWLAARNEDDAYEARDNARAVLAGGDAAPKMRCARCDEVTTAEWRESGWAASHRCCGAAPPRSVESLLDEDDLAVIRMEEDRSGGGAACGALMDSNIRCVLPKGHDGGHAGGPVGDAAAEEKP